jgi:predicted DNA-binding transcriptional regulator AlpA
MDKKDGAVDFVRRPQETARIFGVSQRTLRRMELRGDAPPRTKITERIFGYRDSEIEKFLNSRVA